LPDVRVESFRHDGPRVRLQRLDSLLGQLEELNLRDEVHVSPLVARALEDEGVRNPDAASIPDLIDRIFDIQEPLLRSLSDRSHAWRFLRVLHR
jgi:hypothetical protein